MFRRRQKEEAESPAFSRLGGLSAGGVGAREHEGDPDSDLESSLQLPTNRSHITTEQLIVW